MQTPDWDVGVIVAVIVGEGVTPTVGVDTEFKPPTIRSFFIR
jgi:hypothetical protein